jgi:glucokinase
MNELGNLVEPGVVLAVDAGGSNFKSALVDGDGRIVPDSFRLCPACSDGSLEMILGTYVTLIRDALSLAERRCYCLRGIGVATPGPFDYRRGVSLMRHKFAQLFGISIRERLVECLPEIAALPFRFRHDANSFLAGEIWQGAGQGSSRVGGVTLGTGIGVACFADGAFINNELGSPAVEVSLWNKPCHDGIVEDYISARGLIAAYQKRHPDYDANKGAKGIAEAAGDGDKDAIHAYRQLGAELGRVLTAWCERFKPEKIVFGGQISGSFALFAKAAEESLRPSVQPAQLLPGRQGENAALLGVAAEFNTR